MEWELIVGARVGRSRLNARMIRNDETKQIWRGPWEDGAELDGGGGVGKSSIAGGEVNDVVSSESSAGRDDIEQYL